ncbi:MAG TPA: MGMT family protein [Mycobacteriales bacterium]|nr:MGMT family protein [Mycobacteriales bacterium]
MAGASFAERVLAVVERIPAGWVMSYGDVAELLGSRAPRMVGQVMARQGGGVPWHRVLRSDGTPAPGLADRQLALLAAEGVPIVGGRVDMRLARYSPDLSQEGHRELEPGW